MNILEKINQTKREEVALAKGHISLDDIKAMAKEMPPARPFLKAIHDKHQQQQVAVIAEIKKASPSKGLIRPDFQPALLAHDYEIGGAACLSVLTDQNYFQGAPEYLLEAKNACSLPVLRKDFLIDPYQVYQARTWHADAILLIAASLSAEQMQEMEGIAHELSMTVLVELHDEDEWKKCEQLTSPLFGVNNRNLKTFEVNLQQTARLLPLLQDKTVVCESGIQTHDDIVEQQKQGVHTFLIGETLMRQSQVDIALKNLLQAA